MELQIALVISVILQFTAFFITISLIPKTRFKIAWISISVGFLLMALRRLVEAFHVLNIDDPNKLSDISSWIAVIISIAMLVASIYIRKIFEVLNRISKLRKENEAKLLSATISTEENERKYFSKEIHDGLGPVLSSAKMTISAIDKTEFNERNVDLLNKVESLVDNAIATSKEISNHLTPHVIERYGLKKAIDTFIRNVATKETIKIEFSTNIEKIRYGHNIEVIIYRICCEFINNTLKYASANKITILLHDNEKQIVFKYDDNGIGFEIAKQEFNGMGLTNIKSRVKSLNGSIELTSSINKGFYASIKLPK
ncbi:sensor histidine kinase [Ancylomarina sp. 16SWW S1-10-2]|uniref:sensor histidine kinase n=1 Tax=Ancylomarina sp. 16SWW S1-10-2 TaxID=2499681 RepID=UPI0012ADE579|nr:ATP-binding protein [Ancylomarina sp. 16SWW S1-10-2]MRT94305.1 sensor histidine kinase [Ancylomarina sp. 16SWW S1-10-2]